jgi:uncharacterized protein (TIGR00369 family)
MHAFDFNRTVASSKSTSLAVRISLDAFVTFVARLAGNSQAGVACVHNASAMTTRPISPSSTTPAAMRNKSRSLAEQAKLQAALKALCEQHITFNQTLGLQAESLVGSDTRVAFAMRPELVGHMLYGRLHGGVISATLDVVGGVGLMVAIAERHPEETTEQVMHRFARMATIDLRVDYLRPGLGKRFVASVDVTRLGGRIASTQMRLVNDEGTLIATGAAAYVIS